MFLEWLGVRWWSPDETFFPTCPSADKFIWACEEQWYANQAVGTTPGSKPIEVRDPGTWTAGNHPLWALRMRINTGGYDRSSPAANKVLWANASLGRGGVISYTGLPGGGGGKIFDRNCRRFYTICRRNLAIVDEILDTSNSSDRMSVGNRSDVSSA